jgi:hypothetical protein
MNSSASNLTWGLFLSLPKFPQPSACIPMNHNSCHTSSAVVDDALIQDRTSELEDSFLCLGLDERTGVRCRGKARNVSVLQSIKTDCGPPSLPFNEYRVQIRGDVESSEVQNAESYTSTHTFAVWCLIKHRDFTSYHDELHALNVMTPGNDYTRQNKQCCKYVTVAKAGGLGLYYRAIT